jgi:hypothetical protein
LRIPSKIGPTDIEILYHVAGASPGVKAFLLVSTESSQLFPSSSPYEVRTHVLPAGKWTISVVHPRQITIKELYRIDYGVFYVINIKIQSKLYCSDGHNALQHDRDKFMHHQVNSYDALMIDKPSFGISCAEVLVTYYAAELLIYKTELFINAGSRGYGSIVRISNMALISKPVNSTCSINESITLSEWHRSMDIVYRHTFVNTSLKKLIWRSKFDSDIHLMLTKYVTPTHAACQHRRLVEVTYARTYTVLPIHKGRSKQFTYQSAR